MDESLELRLSLWACLGLSGVYVTYSLLAEPRGGQPFGHWLGIIGTLLMVATETLYSLRKRTVLFQRAGPVRYWLSAHIFMGIVGPFLVLMHSAFEFRGLAGLALGLTVLVAMSGFLGRYLYTAIPRTLAGAETSTQELLDVLAAQRSALDALVSGHSAAVQALVASDFGGQRQARSDTALVLLRGYDAWRYRAQLKRQVRQLEKSEQTRLSEVERALLQRRASEQQYQTFQAARRLLSVWHIVHVPMGLALFSSVIIHIAATVYFRAGLLH
jgi:hypothetical protein